MKNRLRAWLLVSSTAAAAFAGLLWAGSIFRTPEPGNPRLKLEPRAIAADGRDIATLSIDFDSAVPPRVSIEGKVHRATVAEVAGNAGHWRAAIRAGILPGATRLRVEFPGVAAATVELTTRLQPDDSAEDGTPDFLRLDDERDRLAFRRWFTFLAEAQFFQPAGSRPVEIGDCAALIRYAYREALKAHDGGWARAAALPVIPAFESVAKYGYPYTPLGASLFRTRAGPFRVEDLNNGAFLEFADARSLYRFNTHPIGRDLSRGLPGDLLFFRQERGHVSYHSMIYAGPSQLHDDGRRYIVYHTGEDGANPGEIRRLALEDLMHFPQSEWRPLPGNPSFLGLARWNILREGTS